VDGEGERAAGRGAEWESGGAQLADTAKPWKLDRLSPLAMSHSRRHTLPSVEDRTRYFLISVFTSGMGENQCDSILLADS